MWRWDQGRLLYFQFDVLRLIANVLNRFDNVDVSKCESSRSDLIARNREGYNTRTQRIEELIWYGWVNTSFNIDNEICYHLTDSGETLAESIHQLYLTTVRVWEEGNLFDSFPDAIEVFEFVHHNRGCTRRRIYDTLSHIEDIEVLTTKLEESDYIKPVYDKTYTLITYESTRRGIRAWLSTRI